MEEARQETKKWKERNNEVTHAPKNETHNKPFSMKVVASLERVETQYAMMGQKLSEAVQAMGKIQAKVEEMKRDLELAIREKMELESRKAELVSELEVCSFVRDKNEFYLGSEGVQYATGKPW